MDKAYKELKLSEAKKREMIAATKRGRPMKQRSYVSIIAPLFVAASLLFAVISIQGGQQNGLTTGAGIHLVDITQKANFKDILLLWIVSLVFLMMAYVQFLLLAKNPELLVRFRLIRYAHQAFHTWRMVIVAAVPFVWLIIEMCILLLFADELVAQFFVVVLILVNMFLVQLKFIKNRPRATCPHCGVELTNKEIYFNKKCGICGNERHRVVKNSVQEFFATAGGIFIVMFPFFELSIIYILLYGITYMYMTFRYIIPYIYTYQKEDELPPPLW